MERMTKKQNTNRIYRFTATTTNQRLFVAEPKRKAFLIYNNGDNIVDFLDNKNDVYGTGFPVKPTGTVNDDHFNPQGELFVISTVGNSILCVWEILSESTQEVE